MTDEDWPAAGDAVHYAPAAEGFISRECVPAVIALIGPRPDDIFADLMSADGALIASWAMLDVRHGYWGTDGFAGHRGGTWHPVSECRAAVPA